MTRARKIVGRITFVGSGPGDPGLLTTSATDAIRVRTSSSPTRRCRRR